MSSTLVQHCINVIHNFCVYWVYSDVTDDYIRFGTPIRMIDYKYH